MPAVRKAAVQVVAVDPCAAYRSAVEKVLPHARIVADRFHLVRLANQMVTEVRQQAIPERHGRRGRTTDPAWVNRRLLLRAGDRLSARQLGQLKAVFAADNPTGEIGAPGASRNGCGCCWRQTTGTPSPPGCTASTKPS